MLNPGQETFPASASDMGLVLGGGCPVPSTALCCLSMLQALSFRCSSLLLSHPILTPSQPLALPLCSVLAATHALSPLSTQASGRLAASLPSLSPTLAPSLHPLSSGASSSGSPSCETSHQSLTLPGSLLPRSEPWPIPFPSLITGHGPRLSCWNPATTCPLGVTCSYMGSTNSSLARDHFDHMVTPVWFSDCGHHVSPATNKPSLGRKERLRNCPTLKIPKDTGQPETRCDPAGCWVEGKISWTG